MRACVRACVRDEADGPVRESLPNFQFRFRGDRVGRVFSGFPSAAPILRFLLAIWYFQVAVNNLSEILPVSAVVNNQDFRCTRSCRTLVELLLVPGQELDGMIIVDYTTVPYVMCNALY